MLHGRQGGLRQRVCSTPEEVPAGCSMVLDVAQARASQPTCLVHPLMVKKACLVHPWIVKKDMPFASLHCQEMLLDSLQPARPMCWVLTPHGQLEDAAASPMLSHPAHAPIEAGFIVARRC